MIAFCFKIAKTRTRDKETGQGPRRNQGKGHGQGPKRNQGPGHGQLSEQGQGPRHEQGRLTQYKNEGPCSGPIKPKLRTLQTHHGGQALSILSIFLVSFLMGELRENGVDFKRVEFLRGLGVQNSRTEFCKSRNTEKSENPNARKTQVRNLINRERRERGNRTPKRPEFHKA